MSKEKEQVSLQLSKETYKKLKRYAKEQGEPVSEVACQAIERLVAGGEAPERSGGRGSFEAEMKESMAGLYRQVDSLQQSMTLILAATGLGGPRGFSSQWEASWKAFLDDVKGKIMEKPEDPGIRKGQKKTGKKPGKKSGK